ncbi:MAG: hypothetical protein R3E12_19455 [Candidatus Eisenbacteria bacterium]|uniref:CHRD domain-containing protein n=1 Tax=Eiseniibacteriota bacterium TaxID=2212470 RepID=A0A956RNF6_UNCEI|nr:hypothetical protein [Candidatus Eisenbacteria bacterium]
MTKRSLSVLILIALAAGAWSCSSTPSSEPESNPMGIPAETQAFDRTYQYRSEVGDGVIEGTLELHFEPATISTAPMRITGSWELASRGTVGEVGPQLGTGALEGELRDGRSVWLNLNPGWADNNVTLVGTIAPQVGDLTGTWQYSSFVGPVSAGSFAAQPL